MLFNMTKIISILFLLFGLTCQAQVSDRESQKVNDKEVALSQRVETLISENHSLKQDVSKLSSEVNKLRNQLSLVEEKSDSVDKALMANIAANKDLASTHLNTSDKRIQEVEADSQANIRKFTIWGITIFITLLIIVTMICLLLRRSITKIRDRLISIRDTQGNLEEGSLKLDNKLMEILDKQIQIDSQQSKITDSPKRPVVDHTLTLKVADEITRIEKNLSRMDSSIKGYKPLVKAIERLKDNFKAHGYDIVTYLGQNYNEGMRINAEFVIDEDLPEGTRIITSVSKPQVHYNGELLQKASVTISENI